MKTHYRVTDTSFTMLCGKGGQYIPSTRDRAEVTCKVCWSSLAGKRFVEAR